MPDGLLPIGTFARAAMLPIGTLRHYHETGLLEPVHIDTSSGYRYYSSAQLVDAEIIRRLRAMEVPLDDVRRIVRARDPEVTSQVLAAHQRTMTERLAATQRIVEGLQELTTTPIRLLGEQVEERDEPDIHVLAQSGVTTDDQIGEFCAQAFGAVYGTAIRSGLPLAGPAGAVYPSDGWDEGRVPVTAYLPVGRADHPDVTTLPGGRFAVAIYHGAYENIGTAYRGLGAWMAHHQGPTPSECRERYLVGPMDAPDPSGYVTEILWPLGR